MKRILLNIGVSVATVMVVGCNVGGAPIGPDADEAAKKAASLPVDQQVDLIQHSPMSQADKDKRIAALTGKTPSAPAVNHPGTR